MAITVFVVDDHALVRRGISQLLRLERDLGVIGEGSGTSETLDAIVRALPRVAVVDLEMPQIRGADFLAAIKHRAPSVRTLVCTMHGSRGYVAEAVRRGGDGYVLKGSPSERLIEGIRAVAAGGAYIDPALQSDVMRLLQGDDARLIATDLTPQETEVLRLVAEGVSNQEIALRTRQSVETVKLRLRRCFQKLGASDRASAVALAVRRALI